MRTSLDALTPADPGRLSPSGEAERTQIATMVQQFEATLLTEMLRGVNQKEDEGEEDGALGLGGSTLSDVMTAEFGLALSKAGGLGLGEVLAAAFARQRGLTGGSGPELAPAIEPRPGGRDLPATESTVVPLSVVPSDGTVTSGFGWRRDPFSGETRFHAGTDLRAAYGSDVRAAATGTVSFAGDRHGYGMTVVVDHGAGRQTLYAHLSAIDVRPGDTVEGGQTIARSGTSGRSTGAHLHVEAREHGLPVDPERWAAGMDGKPLLGVGSATSD